MQLFSKVLALGLAGVAAAQIAAAGERLVPAGMVTEVSIENVVETGGTVSGTLVNRGGATLRNVRLLIRYAWLWNDERNPGEDGDNPGFAVYHVVPDEIPAGRTISFSYTPVQSLPMREDGRFDVEAKISGFTRVETSVAPAVPAT